jgi:Kdo2-lipid IVA lauroyltransferase/acyltransferase
MSELKESQRRKVLPFRKRVERAAGRMGLRLIVTPLRMMPMPMAQAVGRGFGTLLYHLLGRYRRVALKNLNLIYGNEKSESERVTMAKAVFRHFGAVAAEFVKLPQLSREALDAMTTVEGHEHLCRALDRGKGVLLITGHFGNWETLARWVPLHGNPLLAVTRRANDPKAEELLRGTREQNGAQVYHRGNSARAILQSLKKNEVVILLPDQNDADVFVPFFDLPTGTVDGPAQIHLKTGAPLLFTWCTRTPDNRFHITFEPPEVLEPTGDKEADVARVMTLINARLEAQIRKHPIQWLWLHDRWKASPGVFPDGEEQARRLKMASNKYKEEMRQRDGRQDGSRR